MDCKQLENQKTCACTFGCIRSGKCCECVRYHRRNGEFPACFFSPEAEKTGDRSFAALAIDRQRSK